MVLLPFAGKQAEAHHIVIVLTVEMVLPQDAFLRESQTHMKLNRLIVVSKCLTTELMQAGLREGIPQRSLSKLSPGSFWCIWSCVETPVSYSARGNLMDIHEAQGHSVVLKDQQVPTAVLCGSLEPTAMLFQRNFVLGVHIASDFGMIAPRQYAFEIRDGHRTYRLLVG